MCSTRPLLSSMRNCKKYFTDNSQFIQTLQAVEKELEAAKAAIIHERDVMIKTRQEQFRQCNPNDPRIVQHLVQQTLIKQEYVSGAIDVKARKRKEMELF